MKQFNPGKMLTMLIVTSILCLMLALGAHALIPVGYSVFHWLKIMFLVQAIFSVNRGLVIINDNFDKMIEEAEAKKASVEEKRVPPVDMPTWK